MNKLTRRQLELINRRTIKYPLQIAEKDYFLALAIQLISSLPLGDKLIFKGGTAIHHCCLPQRRFSEDLDFTAVDRAVSLDKVVEALESDGTFRANKTYQSDFTIKIERLQYQGLLGQPGNIKFEVDCHQNTVLPGKPTKYQNVWRVQASPLTMDPREMCAEKIRAVAQRARYRDFYDLFFLLHASEIVLDEAIDILKQKEIRSPITVENIIKNWGVAKEQQSSDLGNIYCAEEIPNKDVEDLVLSLDFDDLETIM
jgi:predicted nucleotidyltransferase component of viral defense system